MIRLPPTTVELTRRDLDWHHQRSANRLQRRARIRARVPCTEGDDRLSLSPYSQRRGDIPSPLFADDDPFPPVSTPEPEDTRVDRIVVRRNPHRREAERLLDQRADSSVAATDSSEDTLDTSSSGWEASGEEDEVPSPVDPNVRATEESDRANAQRTIRPRFDGATEPCSQSSRLFTPSGDPSHPSPTLPAMTHRDVSLSISARLRQISATAPTFASPLRFGEAALSSSPERRHTPRLVALQGPQQGARAVSVIRPSHPPRIISITSQISDLKLDEAEDESPTRQRLERFSPASDADLQSFRAAQRPASLSEEQGPPPSGQVMPPVSSTSTSAPRSPCSPSSSIAQSSPHSLAIDDCECVSQPLSSPETPNATGSHGRMARTPRTPASQVRVYDDKLSPTSQPQTPIGLPRNGIPRMSLGGSFTAPPIRRTRRRAVPDPWRFVGMRESGEPIFRRVLEGEGEQENVTDYERQTRRVDARNEESPRALNALEITPPRRQGRRSRAQYT